MYSQHNWKQDKQSSLLPFGKQPFFQQQHKEILPNATDAKPNVSLSLMEIADFSSTIVYLMWHARRKSVMDLHSSSKAGQVSALNSFEHTKATADIANMTSVAFKKFCRQMLNATQLSESVVLLSLKYIAILLQNSPSIQGADGSEYRLFTVSLMLANKFLDDNTFTNKTWSEVSGMKVTDLNIMELEFLDVLRFRLDVKKEEYERWRTALYGFRHQLLCVPEEIQKQKILETATQPTPINPVFYHPSHLFSQQNYPQPVSQGPFARVPLRIPLQPVYHQQRVSGTPTAYKPTYVREDHSNPYYHDDFRLDPSFDRPMRPEDRGRTACSYYYQNNTPQSIPDGSSYSRKKQYLNDNNPPPAYYNPYHTNSTYLA